MAMVVGIMLAGGCVPPSDLGAPPYTIMLTRSAFPAEIENEKQQAEADNGWDDLYIIHENNVSILYRGHYESYREARRAYREVLGYETYLPSHNTYVQRYFRATIQCARGLDIGPPEWRLGTTDPNQRWTLLVAQFYDEPEADYVGRERFAVEYCTQLREQGVEAYYYHGVGKSYVTLGNFPAEAYQMGTERSTDISYADRGMAMPYVVNDELRALCDRFPYLITNGCYTNISEITPDTGQPSEYREPSLIMEVPQVYTGYEY